MLSVGLGDDVYVVNNANYGAIVELAGGGNDEVRTNQGYYLLNAGVENLTYTGTGSFQASGNALDNVITGNSTDGLKINSGSVLSFGNNAILGNAGNEAPTAPAVATR